MDPGRDFSRLRAGDQFVAMMSNGASGDINNSGSIEVALMEMEQRMIASETLYLETAQSLQEPEPEYYTPGPSGTSAVRGYW